MTRLWLLSALAAPVLPTAWAVFAGVLGPLLLLGPVVAFCTWRRALGWPGPRSRSSTFYWRAWWWYGYRGLYQLDWRMKRRARRGLPPPNSLLG